MKKTYNKKYIAIGAMALIVAVAVALGVYCSGQKSAADTKVLPSSSASWGEMAGNGGTATRVDAISAAAAKSAQQGATQQQMTAVAEYICQNYNNLFKDTQTMERLLYNSYWLQVACQDNSSDQNYAMLGQSTEQAVAGVYLKEQSATSATTKESLAQVKSWLKELGYSL